MDLGGAPRKTFYLLATVCLTVLGGLSFLLPAVSVLAIDPGVASGRLSAGETTVELKHAAVMRHGNEEGNLERAEFRILLTDRELPESILSGPFMQSLERLARQGNVRGILLRLDMKKLTRGPVQGTLLLPPRDSRVSLPTFTIIEKGGGFERFEMGNNRVLGLVRWKFAQGPLPPVEYNVSFSAPLFQDEVTARLYGRRAFQSPQAQALLAFEEALRGGNLEAARGFCTGERFAELVAMRDGGGERAFLEEIRTGIPDREVRRKQVRAVYVRGPIATIVLDTGREKTFRAMVNKEGAWKVD